MKNLLILFSLGLILFSCSKENNKKWIVIDLKVKSVVTGEPLFCPLSIEYKMNKIGSKDTIFTINIGHTSENGFFFKEVEVPRRGHDFKLNIHHNCIFLFHGLYHFLYKIIHKCFHKVNCIFFLYY